MKKLMTLITLCLCMAVMCACGGDMSTPEATVKKAMKCLMEKDYEGYADLIHFKAETQQNPEKLAETKAQIVSLLNDKSAKEFDAKGGIKSYEMNEPVVNGDKAQMKAVITYGNGDTKSMEFSLIKAEDGKWMLDAGK